MSAVNHFYDRIFSIKSEEDFNELALEVFRVQAKGNQVYHDFITHLKIDIAKVDHYAKIPFLPIVFFKTHQIYNGENLDQAVTTFYSSGTGGNQVSRHLVKDLLLYDLSLLHGFQLFYGPISDYTIFALLPSYHQNKNASLLYMVSKLIEASGNQGGFFLDNYQQLFEAITSSKSDKIMLIGVSYALMDFAEQLPGKLPEGLRIIETGGMKGRRKEMIKSELHNWLKAKLAVPAIGSEYGMTELLSQAWSKGDGVFNCPPWMKILTREYNDPFQLISEKIGGINVIDLANLNSCSFIATQDLGIIRGNQFEIAGRFDNSDIRGCNLLVQ